MNEIISKEIIRRRSISMEVLSFDLFLSREIIRRSISMKELVLHVESEMLVRQAAPGRWRRGPRRRGGWPASRHATGKRRPDIGVGPAERERVATNHHMPINPADHATGAGPRLRAGDPHESDVPGNGEAWFAPKQVAVERHVSAYDTVSHHVSRPCGPDEAAGPHMSVLGRR
jgi:hypothetical protein